MFRSKAIGSGTARPASWARFRFANSFLVQVKITSFRVFRTDEKRRSPTRYALIVLKFAVWIR